MGAANIRVAGIGIHATKFGLSHIVTAVGSRCRRSTCPGAAGTTTRWKRMPFPWEIHSNCLGQSQRKRGRAQAG